MVKQAQKVQQEFQSFQGTACYNYQSKGYECSEPSSTIHYWLKLRWKLSRKGWMEVMMILLCNWEEKLGTYCCPSDLNTKKGNISNHPWRLWNHRETISSASPMPVAARERILADNLPALSSDMSNTVLYSAWSFCMHKTNESVFLYPMMAQCQAWLLVVSQSCRQINIPIPVW